MDYSTALPTEFTEGLFENWQSILDRNELCSIICAPISGRDYRITNFLEWQKKTNKQESQYTHLQVHLINHPEDIEHLFQTTTQILIITPGEQLLEQEYSSVLSALTHYKNKYNRGVLIFFETTQSKIQEINITSGHKLLQNISYIPFLDFNQTQHFCSHLAQRWNIKLTQNQIKTIYTYTGGQMWLVKETLRELNIQEQLLSKIFSSTQMQYKKDKIWNQIPEKHRALLTQLSHKSNPPTQYNTQLYADLLNLGIISKEKCKIPEFLEEFTQTAQVDIVIKESDIFFNNINLTSFFSKKEKSILRGFIEAVENKLSREKLAELIWGEDEYSAYSDWALDKTISRFRTKIAKLGIPSSTLVTLREQGYQFKLTSK